MLVERARRLAQALRPVFFLIAMAAALPGVLYWVPALAGADAAYLVLSGSMEPVLSPGDLVFVRESERLAVGDVITFRPDPQRDFVVTHRIIEVQDANGVVRLRTQGDANEDPDPWTLAPESVIGSLHLTIPKWGLLFQLLRSRVGYVAFVLLPGSILIASEFRKLYRELDALDRAKRAAKEARGR